jgi:hypothetical protein
VRTAFDYMYRDAGNFKAFGSVTLEGCLTPDDQVIIQSRLSSGEFFIAEQVGVPALYRQLYQWSGGATDSDHCWHEFVGFRELRQTSDDGSPLFRASDFVVKFASIEKWDETLSPHFWFDDPLRSLSS